MLDLPLRTERLLETASKTTTSDFIYSHNEHGLEVQEVAYGHNTGTSSEHGSMMRASYRALL